MDAYKVKDQERCLNQVYKLFHHFRTDKQ
jgi:hypothetical protein